MARLFLIDDDPIYHDIAQCLLKDNMLFEDCVSYTNARNALDYLIAHQDQEDALPDVILLDLNMPEMSGWDFLCIFEDLLPFLAKKIYVFIVTSSVNRNEELRSKIYAFVEGFISKPLTVETIIRLSALVAVNSLKCDKLSLLGAALTDSLNNLARKSNHALLALKSL